MAFFKGRLFPGGPGTLGIRPLCPGKVSMEETGFRWTSQGDARVKGRGQKTPGISVAPLCVLGTWIFYTLSQQRLCGDQVLVSPYQRWEVGDSKRWADLRSQYCCRSYDLNSNANFFPSDAVSGEGSGVKEGEALWWDLKVGKEKPWSSREHCREVQGIGKGGQHLL